MTPSSTNGSLAAQTDAVYPHAALKALADVLDLPGGPLTPLARIPRPDAAPDAGALRTLIANQEGLWRWSVPALLDPHRTLALLMGDGDTALLGQYLWPDAVGAGPGFKADVESDALRLTGPVATEDVVSFLHNALPLAGIAEPEPLVLELNAETFWTVLALLDAYRMTLLQRRLARVGGLPTGVTLEALRQAWTLGLGIRDPGWAVSLFALLAPDDVPDAFEDRLPETLAAMEHDDLLFRLDAEPDDPDGNLYLPGEGLDLFCRAVAPQAVLFGLTAQTVIAPDEVGVTVVGGWRTGAGIWLADVSDLASDAVVLNLVGPSFFARFTDEVLAPGGPATAPDAFTMETPYAPEALTTALDAAAAPSRPASHKRTKPPRKEAPTAPTCPSCGAGTTADARFCRHCGQPLATPEPEPTVCPECSKAARPGARFCRHCGAQLLTN